MNKVPKSRLARLRAQRLQAQQAAAKEQAATKEQTASKEQAATNSSEPDDANDPGVALLEDTVTKPPKSPAKRKFRKVRDEPAAQAGTNQDHAGVAGDLAEPTTGAAEPNGWDLIPCPDCGYVITRDRLRQHRQTHGQGVSGERKFACNVCSVYYGPTQQELNMHIRR